MLSDLQSSLAGIVPAEPVAMVGEWKSSRRRVYQAEAQLGSGSGPFVEIIDTRWSGTLSCAVPIVCIAFLRTLDSLSWAKSEPPSATQPVHFSVHAYADLRRHHATFASAVGGGHLLSLVIPFSGDAARAVAIETGGHTTGRLARLACAEDVEIIAFMIPGSLIKVGRKRIWHLRSRLAADLPPIVRDLLTHGRNGRIGR